ncbi:MAG: TetR-like C-terminal domain-containing protein, partial [Candidatus Dormiibacterota bacterium]
PGAVSRLLGAYRRAASAEPHLYRLAMTGSSGPVPTDDAVARVAGAFRLVAEDPVQSAALWGLAHGLAMLELDGRLPAGAEADLAWERAASSFEGNSGPH